MFVEFKAKNFASIKEEITFSAVVKLTKTSQHLKDNLIPFVEGKNLYLAKALVLYGANASGKSNVLQAFVFLFDLVLDSRNWDTSKKIKRMPFMLDSESKNKSTKLSVKFIKNSHLYKYILEFDDKKIIYECLYCSGKNNFTGKLKRVFERKFSDSFNNDYDKSLIKKRFIDEIKYNRAYLSVAGHANDTDVLDAYNWFKENTIDLTNRVKLFNYTIRKLYDLKNNETQLNSFETFMNNLVSKADVSIEKYKCKYESEDTIKKMFPQDIFDNNDRLKSDLIKHFSVNIFSVHKNGIELPFGWESEGTKTLFNLSGCTYDAIIGNKLLVIDEIESLHPELLKHLIISFNKNSKKAQMIFTCHDPILLDSKIMAKEQIWFTQKNYEGSFTELYSLKDIHGVRGEVNYAKEYMKGVFGAYPFIELEGFE